MSRSDSRLPSQLRVVGATDLERRLLEASARELPSVELTKKMQQALGLSLAAGAATAATAATARAATAAGAGSAAPAVAWPAISVGVLALAVTGAVVGVGVRSAGTHHATLKPLAAERTATPAPLPVAPPPPAPAARPAAVEVATPVAVATHRTIAGPAHHHGAAPSDLRGEIALVDAARTAVAGGADERALALLGRYDASHPRGTFRPEVAALRIEALDHLGRTAQACALAQKFVAAHPDSPLAERVARVTGLAAR